MKKSLTFTLTLLCYYNLFSQTNLFQDYQGKSSLNLASKDSLMLSLNAADAGLTLSLIDNDIPSNTHHFFGGQLKVSGKDGKFPAFKGGVANFQIEISGTYTWLMDKDNTATYLYGSYKFGISRIKTLTVNPSLLEISNRSPVSNTIQIGYNNLSLNKGNLILGIATQIGWGDNTSGIDSYDYQEIQASGGTPSGGNAQALSIEPTSVFLASAFVDNCFFFKPIVDIGYSIPKARILPMLHMRYNTYSKGTVNTFSPGIGIYYTEKNASSSVVFGMQLFYKDWSDNNNNNNSRWERTVVNAVAGFRF